MLKLDSRCPFYVGCFFTWGTCSCMGAYNSYCKCPHCPECALLGVPSIPILQLTPYVSSCLVSCTTKNSPVNEVEFLGLLTQCSKDS